jgi:hypothetical protein
MASTTRAMVPRRGGAEETGYGRYHQSNTAATGWGGANTGNGLYHESNSAATTKPVQSQQ